MTRLLFPLALGCMLCSCGGDPGPQTSPGEIADGEVRGSITFLNNGPFAYDPATVINMDRFDAAHPEVSVSRVEDNDILARLATLVAGGGEDFDVAEPSAVNVPQFIDIGVLMPLDDLFPPEEMARYPKGTLDAITGRDGHIYGKPHYVLPQVLLYNKRLLAEAGFDRPPATWEEIIAYGRALTHPEKDQWGYAFGLAPNRDTYHIFASYLYQAGATLFHEDYSAAFNNDAGRQALQFMVDVLNTHKIAPAGITTYDGDAVQDLFIRGNAAMVQNWGYTIDRALNREESVVKDDLGVALLPVGPSGEVSGYLVMFPLVATSSTRNPAAAKAFIDFLTNAESQKRMLIDEPGNAVVPPDIFALPEVRGRVPFASEIGTMVEASRAEYHPKSGQVVTILVEEVHAAMAMTKSVGQALADAEARVNQLL